MACACVDTAIWDAIGKALGQPLWRLWGGYRRAIPMISIGGYYGTGIPIADEIAEFRAMGLAGLKFKVGGLSPEEDAQRFREARDAAGPDFILAADANQGLDGCRRNSLRAPGRRLRSRVARGALPLGE